MQNHNRMIAKYAISLAAGCQVLLLNPQLSYADELIYTNETYGTESNAAEVVNTSRTNTLNTAAEISLDIVLKASASSIDPIKETADHNPNRNSVWQYSSSLSPAAEKAENDNSHLRYLLVTGFMGLKKLKEAAAEAARNDAVLVFRGFPKRNILDFLTAERIPFQVSGELFSFYSAATHDYPPIEDQVSLNQGSPRLLLPVAAGFRLFNRNGALWKASYIQAEKNIQEILADKRTVLLQRIKAAKTRITEKLASEPESLSKAEAADKCKDAFYPASDL